MLPLLTRLRPEWPEPELIVAGLRRPRWVRLRLERFSRGIDGRHIDVALEPSIRQAASAYVRALVRESAQTLWKQACDAYSPSLGDAFRGLLLEHHATEVKQARSSSRLERLQLFQLAILRLLLGLLDAELLCLRNELEEARSRQGGGLSGQALQLHRQAGVLARNAVHLRYRIAKLLLRDLMHLENTSMRKLRKSVLGLSWPIPELMLSNPILQLDGFGSARDFAGIYPFVLYDIARAAAVSECLLETFEEWLPADVALEADPTDADAGLSAVSLNDQGNARGLLEVERRLRRLVARREVEQATGNWLDLPENGSALLGGTDKHWPQTHYWQHRGVPRLQRRLNRRLEARLSCAGLLSSVRASYQLSDFLVSIGPTGPEAPLFEYFAGEIGRRALTRRLSGAEEVKDAKALVRRADQLRREFDRAGANAREPVVARLASDFLRLRRDLKLGWRMFQGMDSLRLLSDGDDQSLSLANNTLQLFCRENQPRDSRGSVIGHVIIKVEVRGSERVATEMHRRKLNPAAHFSRFFYDPITRFLARYAARKVAVEGDAMLLSILEYGGEATGRLAVARACRLAVDIIGLQEVMNREHERTRLPLIELGLGIAYADGAPTYLVDQNRRLTISPAIQWARRLASCDALLRETCRVARGRRLCVAAPVHREKGDAALVRYNVNGIELDIAAFTRLHVEISLRKMVTRKRGGRLPTTLYAGFCGDAQGENRLLLVREKPVTLWMGKQLLDGAADGRRFYEVIPDARLIERVARWLGKTPDGEPYEATAQGSPTA